MLPISIGLLLSLSIVTLGGYIADFTSSLPEELVNKKSASFSSAQPVLEIPEKFRLPLHDCHFVLMASWVRRTVMDESIPKES